LKEGEHFKKKLTTIYAQLNMREHLIMLSFWDELALSLIVLCDFTKSLEI
jgi:hypothetical protein